MMRPDRFRVNTGANIVSTEAISVGGVLRLLKFGDALGGRCARIGQSFRPQLGQTGREHHGYVPHPVRKDERIHLHYGNPLIEYTDQGTNHLAVPL